MSACGYLNPGYASALGAFGEPVELEASRGWLLQRSIPSTDRIDAMGCYPYLACEDWSALASDLAALRRPLVSVAAAVDPFGTYTKADLERAFPDCVVHFKDHCIADLSRPVDEIVAKRHLRLAQRALRELEVECTAEPARYAGEFVTLFAQTAARFGVSGIRAFSPQAIAAHLALPGCHMSIARYRRTPVAAHVQFLCGGTVYAHASGATDAANALGASYALYYTELLYFSGKAARVDWGGEAGSAPRGAGLSSFKRGWSTGTQPAYFCGRVVDRAAYDRITAARGTQAAAYFPAYRAGEMD